MRREVNIFLCIFINIQLRNVLLSQILFFYFHVDQETVPNHQLEKGTSTKHVPTENCLEHNILLSHKTNQFTSLVQQEPHNINNLRYDIYEAPSSENSREDSQEVPVKGSATFLRTDSGLGNSHSWFQFELPINGIVNHEENKQSVGTYLSTAATKQQDVNNQNAQIATVLENGTGSTTQCESTFSNCVNGEAGLTNSELQERITLSKLSERSAVKQPTSELPSKRDLDCAVETSTKFFKGEQKFSSENDLCPADLKSVMTSHFQQTSTALSKLQAHQERVDSAALRYNLSGVGGNTERKEGCDSGYNTIEDNTVLSSIQDKTVSSSLHHEGVSVATSTAQTTEHCEPTTSTLGAETETVAVGFVKSENEEDISDSELEAMLEDMKQSPLKPAEQLDSSDSGHDSASSVAAASDVRGTPPGLRSPVHHCHPVTAVIADIGISSPENQTPDHSTVLEDYRAVDFESKYTVLGEVSLAGDAPALVGLKTQPVLQNVTERGDRQQQFTYPKSSKENPKYSHSGARPKHRWFKSDGGSILENLIYEPLPGEPTKRERLALEGEWNREYVTSSDSIVTSDDMRSALDGLSMVSNAMSAASTSCDTHKELGAVVSLSDNSVPQETELHAKHISHAKAHVHSRVAQWSDITMDDNKLQVVIEETLDPIPIEPEIQVEPPKPMHSTTSGNAFYGSVPSSKNMPITQSLSLPNTVVPPEVSADVLGQQHIGRTSSADVSLTMSSASDTTSNAAQPTDGPNQPKMADTVDSVLVDNSGLPHGAPSDTLLQRLEQSYSQLPARDSTLAKTYDPVQREIHPGLLPDISDWAGQSNKPQQKRPTSLNIPPRADFGQTVAPHGGGTSASCTGVGEEMTESSSAEQPEQQGKITGCFVKNIIKPVLVICCM